MQNQEIEIEAEETEYEVHSKGARVSGFAAQEPTEEEIQATEVKEPAQEAPKVKSGLIAVDQKSQMIVARDNSELVRMIQLFMKGTAFPKTIDTEAKVVAAWQIAASLGLPPMVTMQNLAFIHGAVSMWGQLPKALAERTGQLSDFKLILFDSSQKVICLEEKNLGSEVWGAVVQIQRSKRSRNEYSFTEPEAQKAGLLTKSGPWTQYRKIMYARRAMGHAVKFEFADALMGVPVAEYDFHQAPDLMDVTPSQDRDAIAERLAKRAENQKEGSYAKS